VATSNLANSPDSNNPQEQQYEGRLIERLTELVEDASQPKPPQPAPVIIPTEQQKKANEHSLLELWYLGDRLAENYFCGSVRKGRC
jgi:hypothetical protein